MDPSLSNYGWGLPIAASSYAHKIDWALNHLHVVMGVIFVLWGIFMAYCLIRFRQKEGVPADQAHPSPLATYILVGLIFAFDIWLIFVVGLPIWAHIREEIPAPQNAIEVHLISEQFAWNFHYPGSDGKFGKRSANLLSPTNPVGLDESDPSAKDDITTLNQLYLPVNKPVRMVISSKDVIHSFFVPEFRTKQDATPGIEFTIWFEPTMTGKFEIACAQLCGLGHYRMRGDVIVTTQEEFNEWLKSQRRY